MVTLMIYPTDMEGEAPMTNGYSNGVESTGGAELSNNHQTPDAKKHSSSSHSSSKDKHKHSSSKVRQIVESRGGDKHSSSKVRHIVESRGRGQT